MTVIDKDKIIETIQAVTSDVESYVDDFLGIYQFIHRSIADFSGTVHGDRIEKLSSVDSIAIEDLYQDYEKLEHHHLVLQKKEREIVNLFIFGDFEEDYKITWELSEVLADFYVEYLILPILNNVSDREFKARPTIFTEQLKHKSDCMREKEAYIEIAQFFVVLRRWGRAPAKPNLQLMSRGGAIAWHLNARTKKPGFPQKPGFTCSATEICQ